MYAITTTSRFKKDVKVLQKRGYDMTPLSDVIEILAQGEKLPRNYFDHGLNGEWSDFRECHIQSDWILIYRIDGKMLVLTLTRTGTHNVLF